MSADEPCVQPWARGNGTLVGTCDCNGGYSGPTCRELLYWWQIVHTLEYALMLAFTACMFGWCVFALLFDVYLSGSSRPRHWNLKKVARCLIIVGLSMRTCMRAIPRPAMQLAYDKPEPLSLQVVVLLLGSVSHAVLSAAFSLVLGFWVDALHAKMHVVVAKRTKIACFVVALLMLLAIPGSLLATMLGMTTVGAVLIVVPYVINAIFFVTMIIVLRCSCCLQGSRQRVLAEATKVKVAYAHRWMTITAMGWVGAVVCDTVTLFIKPMPHMDTTAYIPNIIGVVFGVVMITGTVMLLEHRVAMSKVCFGVLNWKKVEVATSTQGPSGVSAVAHSETVSRSKSNVTAIKARGSVVATPSQTEAVDGAESTTTSSDSDDSSSSTG